MKATLEFVLPEDEHEFGCAVIGAEAVSVLRQVDQALRNQLKHGHPNGDRALMEECRSEIGALLGRLE